MLMSSEIDRAARVRARTGRDGPLTIPLDQDRYNPSIAHRGEGHDADVRHMLVITGAAFRAARISARCRELARSNEPSDHLIHLVVRMVSSSLVPLGRYRRHRDSGDHSVADGR